MFLNPDTFEMHNLVLACDGFNSFIAVKILYNDCMINRTSYLIKFKVVLFNSSRNSFFYEI
jgi:hypothetical protein